MKEEGFGRKLAGPISTPLTSQSYWGVRNGALSGILFLATAEAQDRDHVEQR